MLAFTQKWFHFYLLLQLDFWKKAKIFQPLGGSLVVSKLAFYCGNLSSISTGGYNVIKAHHGLWSPLTAVEIPKTWRVGHWHPALVWQKPWTRRCSFRWSSLIFRGWQGRGGDCPLAASSQLSRKSVSKSPENFNECFKVFCGYLHPLFCSDQSLLYFSNRKAFSVSSNWTWGSSSDKRLRSSHLGPLDIQPLQRFKVLYSCFGRKLDHMTHIIP